jgi:hypothetical protein
LDEWQTGKEKCVAFSEADYKLKFKGHLKMLRMWGQEVPDGIEEICKDIIDNAR